MRKISKCFVAISCAALNLLGLTACGPQGVPFCATPLGTPARAVELTYAERNENKFSDIKESAEKFAVDFASIAYSQYGNEDNFTVAPLSVYMALSLAAQCSAGETQSQILSTFGITYDTLKTEFAEYYRSLFAEYNSGGKLIGTINFSNSIWLDSSNEVKGNCIDILADKFFCHSYQTEFKNNNEEANQAVRQFISENTNGLIDKNFGLSTETMFALINTLYFKDYWNKIGEDLDFTDNEYSFVQGGGNVKNIKLLQGYYNSGRVIESESFKTFFTKTVNGNKLDFFLPKDGYTMDDIFTAENIDKVKNITSYNSSDEANKQRFYTRCLFPEFTAAYEGSIKSILAQMGISILFDEDNCDFSGLCYTPAFCKEVIHAAKIVIDRKGVEGAAVTIIDAPGAAEPDEFEEVYEDFVIDKSFGFILSDRYGNTLFSGVVNKI